MENTENVFLEISDYIADQRYKIHMAMSNKEMDRRTLYETCEKLILLIQRFQRMMDFLSGYPNVNIPFDNLLMNCYN
jgi:hypothetical protein